jgi:hypothetical protein
MIEDKPKFTLDSSFAEDMFLDVKDLDRAALDQPAIYAKWSMEWALALFSRDKLKDRIKAKRAEISKQIRLDPESFGGSAEKKVAENWVNATVDAHDEVLALEEEMTEKQYEVEMLQIAKNDCDQRGKSINQLIELYKGNYFASSSRGSASHVTAIEHFQDKQREKLNDNPRLTKKLTKKV